MNKGILILSGIMTIGLLYTSCKPVREQGGLPNIILIFADDMGYGDVSALNPNARTYTPYIDELARSGMVFTDAHASASVCTPSRYGLLTGRYALRTESKGRVLNGFERTFIDRERKTMAHFLQDAGYTTACIGKWHLGVDWQTKDGERSSQNRKTGHSNVDFSKPLSGGPNDYGFDYSFIHPASLDMAPYLFIRNHRVVDTIIVLTSEIYPNRLEDMEYAWDQTKVGEESIYWGRGIWWRRGEISGSFRVEECLQNIFGEGINFLESHFQNQPEKPLFLYLPLTAPHTPWLPDEAFQGKSSIETYGDFIMQIDHHVGQVIGKVRELGIEENTIIIFSSDNGAPWPPQDIEKFNHDANWSRRGQKGDVYEGGHRIPLIIKWPAAIRKPSRYDHLVSLTDLYATLAELTGQEIGENNGEDSFSLMEVINGNTQVKIRNTMIHQSGIYGIRVEGWKYIDGLGSGGFSVPRRADPAPGGPTVQLYRIETDSLESENLCLENPEMVSMLKEEMQRLMDQGYSNR